MTCCGKPVKEMPGIKHGDGPGFGLFCEVCGNKSSGATMEDAEKAFIPNPAPSPNNSNKKEGRKEMNNNLPAVRDKLNESHLAEYVSPVIGNAPAIARLIKNNLRYVENLSGESWEKIWNENPESIIHATEEAMIYGAELGKMGDLVPYGKTCNFIPSKEGAIFAVTEGNNSPFESIEYRVVYELDKGPDGEGCPLIAERDGNFICELTMGFPKRGEVAGVSVYGLYKNTGKIRGEFYPEDFLMAKAEEHSTSYQYYIEDVRRFNLMKSEGKTKTMNGKEYYEKEMEGRDGRQNWMKKVFIDDLSNPYAGADKVEMLVKTAVKNFTRPYVRVRGAQAARGEIKTHKDAVKATMDLADRQFDTIDGEVEK